MTDDESPSIKMPEPEAEVTEREHVPVLNSLQPSANLPLSLRLHIYDLLGVPPTKGKTWRRKARSELMKAVQFDVLFCSLARMWAVACCIGDVEALKYLFLAIEQSTKRSMHYFFCCFPVHFNFEFVLCSGNVGVYIWLRRHCPRDANIYQTASRLKGMRFLHRLHSVRFPMTESERYEVMKLAIIIDDLDTVKQCYHDGCVITKAILQMAEKKWGFQLLTWLCQQDNCTVAATKLEVYRRYRRMSFKEL